MDQLARDEAKYDKEINDMEVGDTKHIHFALSLLMSNLNVQNPAPVVGDKKRAAEKHGTVVGYQF